MIESAEEFVRLRTSQVPADYHRAAHEPASMQVWLDVIARYPGMKEWVVHNKTIPIEILRLLADDEDPSIRREVLRKNKVLGRNKIDRALVEKFARDPDEEVRADVAGNRDAPRDIVEQLANDPSSWVYVRARERLAEWAAPDAEKT
uniref:Leucine rich repeat variant n=1 Tax=Caulobacter sp. (strain K31) TaxID=366602 RepID=B0T6B5_CAUSK